MTFAFTKEQKRILDELEERIANRQVQCALCNAPATGMSFFFPNDTKLLKNQPPAGKYRVQGVPVCSECRSKEQAVQDLFVVDTVQE